jgi:hypothetical protein
MVSGLTFEEALQSVKHGSKAYREGWNGKGMFISLAPGFKQVKSEAIWSRHGREHAEKTGGHIDVAPSLTLKNAQDQLVMGWVPSTGDLFAEDWVAEE